MNLIVKLFSLSGVFFSLKKYKDKQHMHAHKIHFIKHGVKFTWAELSSEFFFSDRLLSVVRPSVSPSLNFSHIYLKNYSTNFNQTCHTALLGHRESSLVKWKATPITRMGKSEIANEVLKKNIFFSKPHWPISTKFGPNHPWLKGTHFFKRMKIYFVFFPFN